MILFRGIVAVLILAGCEQAEITQPPIMVVPTDRAGSSGIDVYARDRARGNPVPVVRGQDNVPIRTFGNLDGAGYAEIEGIQCNLDSGLYSVSFVTPANIAVPDYGSNSPAIFVRCVNGATSGSITVEAYNVTSTQRHNSAIGTGLLGAIVIGAVAAANVDNSNDKFGYPPVVVQIR